MARAIDAVQGGSKKALLDKLPKGEGFLVSRNFAVRWKTHVGDSLTLNTPSGPLERPVLGVLDDYRSEKGTIFIDRSLSAYETIYPAAGTDSSGVPMTFDVLVAITGG